MTDPVEEGALTIAMALACERAADNFAAAAAGLAAAMAGLQPAGRSEGARGFIAARIAANDAAAIACAIYLLADAQSPAAAAELGAWAIERGAGGDEVLIAQADMLHRTGQPAQGAALLEAALHSGRSTGYVAKLADFWRDIGLGFQSELLLREAVESGREDLRLRLAEHFVELRHWRSGRDVLAGGGRLSAYGEFLLGRCCVSLLLEEELAEAQAALKSGAEPGAAELGELLSCLWQWRIGADKRAYGLDASLLPPLARRDALLMTGGTAAAEAGVAPRHWRDLAGDRRLPNLLCIGMQRTATTWLWHHFSQHGDVQQLSFKEPAFFSDLFSLADAWAGQFDPTDRAVSEGAYWRGPTRNLHDYLGLFAGGAKVRADFSPSYGELPDESVAAIASLLGAQTAIIVCLRDPVERAWSNLKYDLRLTGRTVADLSPPQRLAHYASAASRRRSDYGAALRAWRRHFPRLHVVWYEQLAADPRAALAEVWRFAGLAPPPALAMAGPLNVSTDQAMPAEDRRFLLRLYGPVYDELEAALGAPAARWRLRQFQLLSA